MYGELCTRFYDLDKTAVPELDLEWYGVALQGAAGRVLEPMCGSGRFLVPLLKRGLLVDGVDPSDAMLKVCRAKLAAAGQETQLWHQTLEAMDLPVRDYAASFIPAGSFGLIVEQTREALRRLKAHLADGALALIEFELPHPSANWPDESVRTVTEETGEIRLTSRVDYDSTKQIETFTHVYELIQSGRVLQTENEILSVRHYSPDEMRNELEAAGFSDIGFEHPEFGWVAKARA